MPVASLRDGFDKAKQDYIAGWQEWMKTHRIAEEEPNSVRAIFPRSASPSCAPTSPRQRPAALIASLAIPWGFSKGDNDLGGYHLVWSRDMVETAGGLLAAGAHEDVRRVLCLFADNPAAGRALVAKYVVGWLAVLERNPNGRDGFAYSPGGFGPSRKGIEPRPMWPGFGRWCGKAAGYLVRNGPVSPQDRWEEDPGYSPFTVGAEIAALLAAADLADLNHEASIATYLREIADVWNTSIERWMYVSGTDWCRKFSVEGYYVRIAPTETGADGSRFQENVHVKNVAAAEDTRSASHLVSPDALALVRFGVRAADDPRIRDTAKVIDALLKVETPSGPTWHRYNDDGYGEHEDGAPFDGTGIGRGWPLLTGERAHYELAAGRHRNRKTTPGRNGILRQRRWSDLGASVGLAGHTGTRTSFWPAFRFGHAARVGARRVSQAAPLTARRAALRPAAANRATLPDRENRIPAHGVAV